MEAPTEKEPSWVSGMGWGSPLSPRTPRGGKDVRGGCESLHLGRNILGLEFRSHCTDGDTEVGVNRA